MQADAFVSTERHSGTLGGVDPTGADAVSSQAQLVVDPQTRIRRPAETWTIPWWQHVVT